ncbi:hypothetical protein [Allorhodopirellula heiligendammensis]|uniref:Uncharacterized protein n=1 Tax=Allorhodopirellula heiligendammensis TaxID=2714739 RepID=A0A5C6C7L4_9BACT|nr:hypothetical protein [Allorhodopirellula heiligendammensis]TWU19491.1 hypothetical protein Poly21_16640 [Allorhodopirellula heiligendammensis]
MPPGYDNPPRPKEPQRGSPEDDKFRFLSIVQQRQPVAKERLLEFCETVEVIYTNWLGYKSAEAAPDEMVATSFEFARSNRALIDEVAEPLAHTLDIIAGGTLDDSGESMTRADLLELLAAVPTREIRDASTTTARRPLHQDRNNFYPDSRIFQSPKAV